jgi:hypothetical protein
MNHRWRARGEDVAQAFAVPKIDGNGPLSRQRSEVVNTAEDLIPHPGLSVTELIANEPSGMRPIEDRTKEEQGLVDRVAARRDARGRAPAWFARKMDDGNYLVGPVSEDQEVGNALTMEALGITSANILGSIVSGLAELSRANGGIDEQRLNRLLAMVRAVQPRDELEALLAMQMAGIHDATVTLTKRLAQVETIPQQDSAERTLNKLARTFTLQMDALKRYRSKGEQKVIVEHVTVNAGGKAIVGTVDTQGGVYDET